MKNDAPIPTLQYVYEYGFVTAGFSAVFIWDGPVPLEVLLMLLLLRVSFSWGEALALETRINTAAEDMMKQLGILRATIADTREQVLRLQSPERESMSPSELASYYTEHFAALDESFEESYQESRKITQILNQPQFNGLAGVMGLVLTVVGAALVGWVVSLAF